VASNVAVFVYADWLLRYPEFAAVTEPTAQAYFDDVGALWIDNSESSTICPLRRRLILMYMLVAHLAFMAKSSASGSGLAGRISSASEGSVSVSTEYNGPAGLAWFAQSPYGQAYIQAMAGARQWRYRVPAQRSPYAGVLPPWQG
jgi:hypothetical protein